MVRETSAPVEEWTSKAAGEEREPMYFYIELWKPRPKWLALIPEDREKFLF
jgi:hypothetical protein